MKKIFEAPKLDIIKLNAKDVIATSSEGYENETSENKKTPDMYIS